MYDEDKIKEYLAKLPQNIKDIMYSLDYPKLLQEIVAKNKLLIDQGGKLEVETTLVLSGLNPLREYTNNLSRELSVSKEKAGEIAKDVDNFIFKNIRASLEKINDEDIEAQQAIDQRVKTELNKENILFGIENPKSTKESDQSISISSLNSNNNTKVTPESFTKGIEVKKEISSEIPKGAILPPKPLIKIENTMFHDNVSPIEKDIVETKKETALIIPKETVVIEEKTKLPEKPKTDIYREPTI